LESNSKAQYVFKFIYGDTFEVIKDVYGDFKIDKITNHSTVKKYMNSSYNVRVVDQDGDLIQDNF